MYSILTVWLCIYQLEMGYCSADNFNSLEDPQKSKYNLKSRLCILDHDYYIQGDDESTVYTYI